MVSLSSKTHSLVSNSIKSVVMRAQNKILFENLSAPTKIRLRVSNFFAWWFWCPSKYRYWNRLYCYQNRAANGSCLRQESQGGIFFLENWHETGSLHFPGKHVPQRLRGALLVKEVRPAMALQARWLKEAAGKRSPLWCWWKRQETKTKNKKT